MLTNYELNVKLKEKANRYFKLFFLSFLWLQSIEKDIIFSF
jgi:hypothetical protein